MAKQLGREFLLQRDISGTYTSLAGCTTTGITINNEVIDVTTPPTTQTDPLWAQSLNGVKSMEISADAVFLDETAEANVEALSRAKDASGNFRLTVPDYGTYTGVFRITSFAWSGSLDGAATWSITLQSSGAITFATV